jgi:uncharacterized protein YpiB (UPF0302 family)
VIDEAKAPAPHDPDYFREKAREMLKQADQAITEEDRQTFRALAEQYEQLAKVAVRPHL